MKNNTILWLFFLCSLIACSNAGEEVQTTAEHNTSTAAKGNYITMKIDGREWNADTQVEGALLQGMLVMSGKKGSGSTQQEMNISLNNLNAAGTYTISNADAKADGSAIQTGSNIAQFANLTSSNYLCGGSMQGNQLTVVITKASATEIEGTFHGTMQCVEGNTIKITDGKFYYHE